MSALLCVNCDFVVVSKSDECPLCQSKSLLSLANVLGQIIVRKEAPQIEVGVA